MKRRYHYILLLNQNFGKEKAKPKSSKTIKGFFAPKRGVSKFLEQNLVVCMIILATNLCCNTLDGATCFEHKNLF